jgi:transcriptional regulator with XRE-family HTH domain
LIYFSNNLKLLRSRSGLNQSELASRIGVKPNTISNYENGVSEPDFKILNLLIKIFDVDLNSFLYQNFSENAQVDAQVNAQANSKKQKVFSDEISEAPPGKCRSCAEKQALIDTQKDLIEFLKEEKIRLNNTISELKEQLNDTEQTKNNGQKRKAS